mmetsp:Transcript_34458/g.70376  ORF Transcript_34458/g.70376 Transcript_34458/m.70376 type:complete len:114 (-) Transcript_34458:884-1225(-)
MARLSASPPSSRRLLSESVGIGQEDGGDGDDGKVWDFISFAWAKTTSSPLALWSTDDSARQEGERVNEDDSFFGFNVGGGNGGGVDNNGCGGGSVSAASVARWLCRSRCRRRC